MRLTAPLQNLGFACLSLSRCVSFALLLAVTVLHAGDPTSKPPIREDSLRAAFIYRLATFVSWPQESFESAAAPIRICLLAGSTELERVLKLAAGKVQAERSLELRILHGSDSWSNCHLIYEPQAQTPAASNRVNSPYSLVIVDSLERLKRGGHLALVMEKQQNHARLVFYAERKRIGAGTFKLSAKLLPLLRFI